MSGASIRKLRINVPENDEGDAGDVVDLQATPGGGGEEEVVPPVGMAGAGDTMGETGGVLLGTMAPGDTLPSGPVLADGQS